MPWRSRSRIGSDSSGAVSSIIRPDSRRTIAAKKARLVGK